MSKKLRAYTNRKPTKMDNKKNLTYKNNKKHIQTKQINTQNLCCDDLICVYLKKIR